MKPSWSSFEEKVREVAKLIWGRTASPENIGGVDVDAVIRMDPQLAILIEITEIRKLGKVREDVNKLTTAQNELYAKRIIARSYCVIDADSITDGMKDAGKANGIIVLTFKEFSCHFFDFPRYSTARLNAPFGSAVNPLTGEKDDSEYVPVRYSVDGSDQDIGTNDIAKLLQDGHKVVLLGEYGSGKSRCIREVYRALLDDAFINFCYPFAVDLRDVWGLKRGTELIRRHLDDLGLEALGGNAVRALNAGALVMLLDGFDELGSQAWNNDPARLRAIRAQALQGVKDMIQRCQSGVLIAGREHYFPANEEMFKAFGLEDSSVTIIRSKEEFNDTELQEFFDQRNIDIDIPPWLPRRPLICQTINNLPEEDRAQMFDAGASETVFWDHFMRVLCVRDARIHVAFDPDTIFGVLKRLGRFTRSKASNVGPIALGDMQRAFEEVVGQPPGEEASVMLQRLPSLGRLGRESDDRQFTDTYILDGLRAKDISEIALSPFEGMRDVLTSKWGNGLDALGQRILASDARCSDKKLITLAALSSENGNKTLASDIVASIMNRMTDQIDFNGLKILEGHFVILDLSKRNASHLILKDCTFGSLVFGNKAFKEFRIVGSLAEKVYGASSSKGLPNWADVRSDQFSSVDNTASIKRIGLKPAQQMLVTTIRKTFFQKGAGRKEEALTRGFARIGNPNLVSKVINLLKGEGLLEVTKGSDGVVYIPVRKYTGRMEKIMSELDTSNDPLWIAVTNM